MTLSMPSAKTTQVILSNLSTVVVGVFLGLLLLCITGVIYQRIKNAGPYRLQITGKVVNKTTQFRDTELRSYITRKLIIEEKDGTQTQITVSDEIYNQAQTGMWFEKNQNGIKLIVQEPNR